MSNLLKVKTLVDEDPWRSLKMFTVSRIALGRTGNAIPLKQALAIKLAHAHAKDAVFSALNKETLSTTLSSTGLPIINVTSKATNRIEYLQRPDLGRSLHQASALQLENIVKEPCDIAIVIADGLSATAVNKHGVQLLARLIPAFTSARITVAPLTIVTQARVAIADEIGFWLKCRLSLILIGERPGLSAPHSMGAYLTWAPQAGLTDESRNCISNIQDEGLSYDEAAEKIMYLVKEALRMQLTGVQLKDNNQIRKDSLGERPKSLD